MSRGSAVPEAARPFVTLAAGSPSYGLTLSGSAATSATVVVPRVVQNPASPFTR